MGEISQNVQALTEKMAKIDESRGEVAVLEEQIDRLNQSASNNTSLLVTSLKANIESIQEETSNLKGSLDNLQNSTYSLQQEVSHLAHRETLSEGSISSIQSQVKNIASDTSRLEDSMVQLQSSVSVAAYYPKGPQQDVPYSKGMVTIKFWGESPIINE